MQYIPVGDMIQMYGFIAQTVAVYVRRIPAACKKTCQVRRTAIIGNTTVIG